MKTLQIKINGTKFTWCDGIFTNNRGEQRKQSLEQTFHEIEVFEHYPESFEVEKKWVD
jgi:hypothetical protein